MILSTQTSNLFGRFGADDAINIFSEAGFDAIDFSMFGLTNDGDPLVTADEAAFAKELRQKVEAAGLRFNQAHAPFPSWRVGDDAYNAKMPARVEKSIKIAGLLGAGAIVVHPIAIPGGGKEQKDFNLKMYREFAPIAKEYGIKVALENMWGHDSRRNYIIPNVCSFAADLCDYYDALDDSEAFTICLDLGHCGLIGEEAQDAIRILGHDRLGALHVHDNNYIQDNHTIPYDYGMRMNWDKITKALGEIDYSGDFTYEADVFFARFDRASMPIAAKFMADIGRALIAKIDAAREAK